VYLREILESEYGNKSINEVWGAVAGGLSRIFQPLARNLGWLHRSELAAETLFATIGEGWNPFDEIYQWQQGNITHGEALVGIRNFLGTISFIFAAIRGIKLLENIWKNVKPIKNLLSFIKKLKNKIPSKTAGDAAAGAGVAGGAVVGGFITNEFLEKNSKIKNKLEQLLESVRKNLKIEEIAQVVAKTVAYKMAAQSLNAIKKTIGNNYTKLAIAIEEVWLNINDFSANTYQETTQKIHRSIRSAFTNFDRWDKWYQASPSYFNNSKDLLKYDYDDWPTPTVDDLQSFENFKRWADTNYYMPSNWGINDVTGSRTMIWFAAKWDDGKKVFPNGYKDLAQIYRRFTADVDFDKPHKDQQLGQIVSNITEENWVDWFRPPSVNKNWMQGTSDDNRGTQALKTVLGAPGIKQVIQLLGEIDDTFRDFWYPSRNKIVKAASKLGSAAKQAHSDYYGNMPRVRLGY